MIYPTVHLNGTSKGELIEQLCAACSALNEALAAVTNAAPNARDYYVQPNNATAQAVEEHSVRIAALVKVRDELMDIAEHIDI